MKFSLLNTAVLGAVLLPASQAVAQSAPAGYQVSLAENFDSFDSGFWKCEEGYQRNNEIQNYTSKNVWAADGNLVIHANYYEDTYWLTRPDWGGGAQACHHDSGSVWSKGHAYGYGIYEIRAKIPVGEGFWPAIWTTGNFAEWPFNGEIDILEYYPTADGHSIHANVAHGGNTQRYSAKWNSKHKAVDDATFGSGYHVWRMEYTDDYIKLFCDGELLNYTQLCNTVNVRTDWYPYTGRNPYRDPENRQELRLNLALGGDNGGKVDNTKFPVDYLIDYVYVYEPTGSEFEVPEAYGYKGADGSLIANGSFEDPAFAHRQASVWYNGSESKYSVVDGHLPYWKIAQDDYNVRVSVPSEDGRGNYLHIERDANHAWAEGTVSYHAKGLVPGQKYNVSALVRSAGGAPQGFRVYKCDERGYKTYEVVKDMPVTCGDAWTDWTGTFEADAENVAIEIYMKNDWNNGNGNGNGAASFDVDDVTLKSAPETVIVPVGLTNPSFDENGDYSKAGGFIGDNCITGALNGWEMYLSTGGNVGSATWHIAGKIGQEGDRTYLHMQRNPDKNDWNTYLCAKQTIPVTPGKEYTLSFDKRTDINDWAGWNGNVNGWMPCGALIEGTTAGNKEIDCAGNPGNWETKSHTFVASGNTVTLTFMTRRLEGKKLSGYCDFDNVNLVALNSTTDIADVADEATEPGVTGVYTLSGIRVADTADSLASGIYVVVTTAGAYKIVR